MMIGRKKNEEIRAELRNFLRKKVDDKSLSEDLLQDTYLRVLKAGKFNQNTVPRSYLFSTARSVLADHFRSKKRSPGSNLVLLDEIEATLPGPDQEQTLEHRERLRIVEKAIASLPPRAQKAFILSRIYRFSYAEVGNMMGISPRTVENHVAKGLLHCVQELQSREGVPTYERVVPLRKHPRNIR